MSESKNKVSLVEENETVTNCNQLKMKAEDGKLSPLPFGRGCMKGKMWMSDDFDAPMDDFRECMQREPFDYTRWQTGLFENMTVEEISRNATDYRMQNNQGKGVRE